MRKLKQFSLLLVLVMAVSLFFGACSQPEPVSGELVILHTNDMHGFFQYGDYDGMGAALLATKIKEIRAENEHVLLLDGGDAIQGNNLVTLSDGENAVKVLNALGYDAMAVGNHEFDYGSERLLELAGMLDFPMLAANVVKEDDSEFLPPYVIKDVDGIKVGIFGLATPETTYKSHPDNTKGLVFKDPIETASEMVAALEEETDFIIAIAHLGAEGDITSASVAQAVDGIDVMIDGHSHTELPEGVKVNNTLIVQAGEKTKNLGIVRVVVEKGEVTSVTASLYTKEEAAEKTPDSEMAALVEELVAQNAIIAEEVVGTAPYALEGERENVRTGETNLGNMITEALLDISGADVALTNGGGIRTSIDEGDVTKGEVLTVLPFGNTVRVIELTGADIKAAIENGISAYPEASGAFPHIAGMTVTFDASKEAGSRVVEIMVAGEALDEAATYTLVTNDFLVAGGDGYSMFAEKEVVGEYGAMDEVLIDYMNEKGFEKAPVTGRIKNISK